MIRVAIADDHPIVRDGLQGIIGNDDDMSLAWSAESGKETVSLYIETPPDVLVLDFRMPDIDGLEVIKQIIKKNATAKILILTMHDNDEYAVRLIQAGASGFIVKDASSDELRKAIRIVAGGDKYIPDDIKAQLALRNLTKNAKEKSPATLSDREMQVLVSFAEGKKPREIAEQLGLSYSTVENHRQRIITKLGLRNNADLTRFAIRHGLIAADK